MQKDNDKIILVADYGRSGQGWLSYMLCYILNAKYIETYCLLRGLAFTDDEYISNLTQGNIPGREKTKYSLIVKTHSHPDPFFSLTNKVILLARDPRDVAVSGYFRNRAIAKSGTDVNPELQNKTILRVKPRPLNFMKKSLRQKLKEWLWLKKGTCYLLTAIKWRNFYAAWEHVDLCYKVRYEDLLTDPKKSLSGMLKYLDIEAEDRIIDEAVEKFSFEKLSGRKKGEEQRQNFVYRKGIAGDYKNNFNFFELSIFRKICRDAARKWGYAL